MITLKLKTMPTPSLNRGIASVIDVFGTLTPYRVGKTSARSDYWAIMDDWEAIGGDLNAALKEVNSRQRGQK